jgi:hypothetical protein
MTLPATKIQYQIIGNASQSTATSSTIINKEGYETAGASDKYGREAIPCKNPRLKPFPSAVFINLLRVWRMIAFGLILIPGILAVHDAVSRKMPLGKFFAWTAGGAGILIMTLWVIDVVYPEPVQPWCNFDDLYRVISFTPNWLFIPWLVAANLLAYFGTRHNLNNENAVVTTP